MGCSQLLCVTRKMSANGTSKPPQSRSRSFLSKLFHLLVPCVSDPEPQQPLELPDTNHTTIEKESPPPQPTPPPPEPEAAPVAPPEPPKLTIDTESRPVTPPAEEVDVVLPPTPETKLLPPEETEGVTSGAVQPPGSKGDSPIHEKAHSSRRNSVADGEDSDGTSYTEEEEIEEVEDDEDRLIFNGGAGIPIGPASIFLSVSLLSS